MRADTRTDDHLEPNDHVIAVVVDNAPNSTTYPQRADFTFYGGIYRERHPDHGASIPLCARRLRRAWPRRDTDALRLARDCDVRGGGHRRRFGALHGRWRGMRGPASVVDGAAKADIVIDDVRRWHGVRDPYLYRRDREPAGRRRRRRRGEPSLRLPRVRRRSRPWIHAQRRAVPVAWGVAPPGLGGGRQHDHHRHDADGSRVDPGDRRDHGPSGALPTRPTLLRPVRRRRHRGVGRDPADHRVPPRRNGQRHESADRAHRAEPPPCEHRLLGSVQRDHRHRQPTGRPRGAPEN